MILWGMLNMSNKIHSVFSFPNPVNEVAARLVASMVVILSIATIITGESWLIFILNYGFLARVLTGPTLSPMGLVATKVIAPRISLPRPTAGPPKRFAQIVGLIFSTSATVVYVISGDLLIVRSLIGIITIFASLEAFVGFCAGCFVFNKLMRWGFIPESICKQCNLDYRTTPSTTNN